MALAKCKTQCLELKTTQQQRGLCSGVEISMMMQNLRAWKGTQHKSESSEQSERRRAQAMQPASKPE